MTEEFEEHVFSEMDDIRGDNRVAVPDVGHIHRRVASQQQRAGFAVAALVMTALAGFWAIRPNTTELATDNEAVTTDSLQAQGSNHNGAVADDSAPLVFEEWAHEPQLRLITTPRWFVVASEGVPDSDDQFFGDGVSFDDNHIVLGSCLGDPYDIEWTQDGFTVVRPTPIDPSVPVPLIGCPEPSGIQLATMPPGLSVSTLANSDGTIDLVSAEWKVTLSANPQDDALLIYRSLPEAEAAALAEERGWRWRVVHRDGVDLGYTLDYDGKRLNFSVRDGIVIHVRTDDELGTPDAPQVTTTTIVAEAETDQYLGLPLEKAGVLAESFGREWRVINIDGEPQEHNQDIRPDRMNFTIADDVVVLAETDAQMHDQPSKPFTNPSLTLECDGRSSSTIVDFLRPLTAGAESPEEAVHDFQLNSDDWQLRQDWQGLTLGMIRGNVAHATAVFLDANNKTYLVLSARPIDGFWVIDGIQSCEP